MSKRDNAGHLAEIKKFLRPDMARELLAATASMLPEGSFVYLFFQGCALVPGSDSTAGLDPAEPDVASIAFALGPEHSALVCARIPGLAGSSPAERDRAEGAISLCAKSLANLAELESARRGLGAETLGKYRELAVLRRAIHSFNATMSLGGIVEALMADCRTEEIPSQAGILFLRETFETGFEPEAAFGPAAQLGLTKVHQTALFAEVTARGKGEIVNDLANDARWDAPGVRPGSLLLQPVVSPNLCLGAIVLATSEPGSFAAAHLKHLSMICAVAGMAIENAFNFEGVQLLMDALLKALAAAIDSRDRFTSGHSERVAKLAVALAMAVNAQAGEGGEVFCERELRELYYAGILHDVGKIGIREEVLTKETRLPRGLLDIIGLRLEIDGMAAGHDWTEAYERLSRINAAFVLGADDLEFIDSLAAKTCRIGSRKLPILTESERQCLRVRHGNLTSVERLEIQRHPAESHRILRHIPFPDQFKNLLAIIHQHHERLDGSGYPAGERGAAILAQSRILAIVDTYDAITQERHYKRAMSRSKALTVLGEEVRAGRLDEDLVGLFCRDIAAIEREAETIEPKVWRRFGKSAGKGRAHAHG